MVVGSLTRTLRSRARHDRSVVAGAAALDAAAVVLFVLIGRGSHDEEGRFLVETGKVAAPFLIALAAGWLLARAWRSPLELRTGAVVLITTVAGGMALRPLFGRSVQVAFVIVTAAFTALTMIGWRLIARQLARRRAR